MKIWLLDSGERRGNPNPHFVLEQAAEAVLQLSSEGRTLFLHCAAGQSWTSTVAALDWARTHGVSPFSAFAEVVEAQPDARPNRR